MAQAPEAGFAAPVIRILFLWIACSGALHLQHVAVRALRVEEARKQCAHRQVLDISRVNASKKGLCDQVDRRRAEPPPEKRSDGLVLL